MPSCRQGWPFAGSAARSLPCSLTLIPTSGRQPTWRAFIYHSKPEDMILGNLLLLVLSFYAASVFAEDSDYDGTRIANRTIERVRLLFSFPYKTCLEHFLTNTTRRLFDCRRTRYLLPTSTKTFKIGASRVLATLVPKLMLTRLYCSQVVGLWCRCVCGTLLLCHLLRNFQTCLCRIPTNIFG